MTRDPNKDLTIYHIFYLKYKKLLNNLRMGVSHALLKYIGIC